MFKMYIVLMYMKPPSSNFRLVANVVRLAKLLSSPHKLSKIPKKRRVMYYIFIQQHNMNKITPHIHLNLPTTAFSTIPTGWYHYNLRIFNIFHILQITTSNTNVTFTCITILHIIPFFVYIFPTFLVFFFSF